MASKDEQIEKLQQELAALKKEFNEYAYAVSHDFSAPLRSIEGFSGIILKTDGDKLSEKSHKNFKRVIDSAADAKLMLNALLEYSRLNTHEFKVENVDVSLLLQELLQELVQERLEAHSTANIKIHKMPSVDADAALLKRLFARLLDNALLYQENSEQVEIDIKSQDDGSSWTFSIEDKGIGMNEKQLAKAFGVLKRGVAAKHFPGVGMGLSIADKIVALHGGKIWAASSPGQGSTFYFTIPKTA